MRRVLLALSLMLAACDPPAAPADGGEMDAGAVDAGAVDGGELDGGERDAGLDGAAGSCGDGVLDLDETCDTAIAEGVFGACVTSCTTSRACTTSMIVSAGTCSAHCEERPILASIDGDDCCPTGATALTDADCAPVCGNGAIEAGESCDDGNRIDADACDALCRIVCGDGVVQSFEQCDLAIPSGAGACPTACAPSDPCQLGALSASGTCAARCLFSTRASSSSGDGCCLAGDYREEDTDCTTSSCGNGIVESWEACDTAARGTSVCPTSCDDGDACTMDVLSAPGACLARCTRTTIRDPLAGDGCCPAGADSRTDSDCAPRLRCEERTTVRSLVSDDARELVLSTDPSGALIAVWIEHHTTSSDAVRWSRRDPSTGVWSSETAVDGLVNDDAVELALADDAGGDLVAVWVERSSSADRIQWSRLDATTDTWSTETAIDGLVSDDAVELVLATESTGALIAAWVERGSSADRIQWSRLDLATDAWSTESSIDGLVSDDATELRVVADRLGALIAVWVERSSSFDRIQWSRLDGATDAWSTESSVDGLVSDDATSLRVTTDRTGELVALWSARDVDSSDRVEWSRLDAAARTWSAESAIDGLVSDDASDLAEAHDRSGELVAAWVERRGDGSDRVEWSRLDQGMDRWSTESSVDGLVSEDAAQLRLHRAPSGDLLALWASVHPSFGALEWSRLDESTGRWTSERAITSLEDVREVALLDVLGTTHVVWIEREASSSDRIVSGACGVW